MEPVIKIRGFWDIKLIGETGELKEHIKGENVITTNGKEYLASWLNSSTTSGANTLKYIAIGTGSTAEAAADTALGVETARATGASTYTSGAIFSVTATFAAGTGTGAVAEYGLYSSSTGGTLFSRDTEAVINKGASDTLVVTTQVTLS